MEILRFSKVEAPNDRGCREAKNRNKTAGGILLEGLFPPTPDIENRACLTMLRTKSGHKNTARADGCGIPLVGRFLGSVTTL
jgi:hypothetical protein